MEKKQRVAADGLIEKRAAVVELDKEKVKVKSALKEKNDRVENITESAIKEVNKAQGEKEQEIEEKEIEE